MQTIPIPDFGTLTLATIVCDDNGTLAGDGAFLPGVKEAALGIARIRQRAGVLCTIFRIDNPSINKKRAKGELWAVLTDILMSLRE